MNDVSLYLLTLAGRLASAYTSQPGARAAMVSGSAAEGVSDLYSDVDMMVYYDAVPPEHELDLARIANGGGERLWQFGSASAGALMQSYLVNGVECQIVHMSITAWEAQMDEVLNKFDVETPLQKALSGLLSGVPLHGNELIEVWKNRAAAYPDGLRVKMVAHNLNFFSVWRMGDRFFARDANIWFHQIRVETLQRLLAILAGLNRVYYTTFQFKHTALFIEKLKIVPTDLSDRIETLLAEQPAAAAILLGELVTEIIELVEQELPEVDTSACRKMIEREFKPWQIYKKQNGE